MPENNVLEIARRVYEANRPYPVEWDDMSADAVLPMGRQQYWVEMVQMVLAAQADDGKLSLIGRERFQIDAFTKALHDEARRHGDYTPIREDPRGNHFEVMLEDRRVARVVVTLDRIEPKDPT